MAGVSLLEAACKQSCLEPESAPTSLLTPHTLWFSHLRDQPCNPTPPSPHRTDPRMQKQHQKEEKRAVKAAAAAAAPSLASGDWDGSATGPAAVAAASASAATT